MESGKSGHLSSSGQAGESLLPERLIGQNSDRVGQIQTAGVGPHGNADTAVPMGLAELLGKPGGLLSEEQEAAIPELSPGLVLWGLGSGQPQIGHGMFRKEMVQRVVDPEIHHGPVIQSGPFNCPVTDIKAQGLDQVQTAAGGGTGAGDISGIHGDLRLYQDDIQHPGSSLQV